MQTATKKVFKYTLPNGLTVLVRPQHLIPKVSLQLWYNVGSKHEKSGEKGIAHLIEHMIFKGTQKLSESDINLIVNKLSGSCNAFTSYDYTGYLFDMPTHHWDQALEIMADCMRNCTFKQEFLNSEMKAVIQELKMYKDNYPSTLIEAMISAIFPDHPYHFPIIGFKQDLWSLKRETLVNFYQKHYVPNNATLVVVGDTNPDDVYAKVQKLFSDIPADSTYAHDELYHHADLINQNITLYRDVQQPMVMLAFQVPGARAKLDYPLDVLSWILGSGKSSRLYHLLVDELQLVTELDCFTYDLFDYGLFFIYFQPKNVADIDHVIRLIHETIASLKNSGPATEELQRAIAKSQMEYLSVLESNQKQAYVIGQSYLATGDDQFLFTYLDYPKEQLTSTLHKIVTNYLRPSAMHRGTIVPIETQDAPVWLDLQTISDQEDERILKGITRDLPVEQGAHVHTIPVQQPTKFTFPHPEKIQLSNGLTVLYYHNPNIATVDFVFMLKAKNYYDPEGKQGLNNFMSSLLDEGTKNHPGSEYSRILESYGMTVSCTPGYITLNALSRDLKPACQLLAELLTQASFEENAVEKVRTQIISDIKDYWDTPSEFAIQLAREQIYGNHPYHKNNAGSLKSVAALTRTDLLDAYKKFITPQEAVLAVVGDITKEDLMPLLEKNLGGWQGPRVPSISFPELSIPAKKQVIHKINRDQIVLCFAGLSIARHNPLFDKLLLFDQIFTGGVLGAMSSRLFQLREQSGLFYTIGGSLLHHADEQPGMVFVKTIVSLDRLKEAESAILGTIAHAADHIEPEELAQAQNGLINAMVDNFESNRQIAATFMLLERFKLPTDYFDKRPEQLLKVRIPEIKEAVKKILVPEHLVTIKIGRM